MAVTVYSPVKKHKHGQFYFYTECPNKLYHIIQYTLLISNCVYDFDLTFD